MVGQHGTESIIRRELLNVYVFTTLNEVRDSCDEWRMDYNAERPHKSLGYLPPLLFAEQWYQRSKYAQELYPQLANETPPRVFGSQLVDKIFEKQNVQLKTLDLN